jgi:hypothetical protein
MVRSTVGRALFTAAVLLAATRTVANAATTLTTPAIDSVGPVAVADCIVTNISSSPVLVSSLQLFWSDGTEISPDYNSCPIPPATLPAHASCHADKVPTDTAYCTATASSSKIRLSLNLLDVSNSDRTMVTVPGTK